MLNETWTNAKGNCLVKKAYIYVGYTKTGWIVEFDNEENSESKSK